MRPRYASCADLKLAMALREYDTIDRRPMVAELPPGQRFSLNGVLVLTKRSYAGPRYKCTTARGVSIMCRPRPGFTPSMKAVAGKPG